MNRSLIALVATIVCVSAWISSAQAVTFQLKGRAAVEVVDETASFSLTKGGITPTLTANVGVLNTTALGFGVNHPVSGDLTQQIDGINASESVSITLNVPVTFDTLVLSLFTPTPTAPELATVTIGSAPPFPLVPQPSATDTYNFSVLNTVNVGETVVLAWVAGNGFSFDSFAVNAVTPRAVPEPTTLLLLGSGLAGLVAWRRRR